jgi:RHS repeat-associated protein
VLAGWHHDYDRVGNKDYQEDLRDATQSELYAYDKVYRVTSFKRGQLNAQKDDITSPSRTQTWTLDPLGNWDQTVLDSVTETRTHNSVNELTQRTVGQDPSVSLAYDDAGNLYTTGTADGSLRMYYDYRNRLKWVERKESGEWESLDEYSFDALGRIAFTAEPDGEGGWTQRRFIWGGISDWQCLEECETSGDLVARYTYAPGYIDAVAVQERDLNADDDFGDTNEVTYYHSNTLFSVMALTDASESVVERYRYDAYGACTVLDPDGSADSDGLSDVENPYTYTGRRLDDESGLMQYRHRWYSPTLGRFISRDPAGYRFAMSLLVYCGSLPAVLVDPFGLAAEPPTPLDQWMMTGEGMESLQNAHDWEYGPHAPRLDFGDPFAPETERGQYRRNLLNSVRDYYDNLGPAGQDLVWRDFGWRPPSPPPSAPPGPSVPYISWDIGAEYMWFGGGGVVRVSCCDENRCRHVAWFKKICVGAMVAAGVSAHVLAGVNGEGCPDAYSGWFTEWAVGPLSGFHGSKVDALGGGYFPHLSPFHIGLGVARCKYTELTDDVKGKC